MRQFTAIIKQNRDLDVGRAIHACIPACSNETTSEHLVTSTRAVSAASDAREFPKRKKKGRNQGRSFHGRGIKGIPPLVTNFPLLRGISHGATNPENLPFRQVFRIRAKRGKEFTYLRKSPRVSAVSRSRRDQERNILGTPDFFPYERVNEIRSTRNSLTLWRVQLVARTITSDRTGMR